MAPSTLQARIKAFEALEKGASRDVLDSVAIHSEPEHLLDSPHSPAAAAIPPIIPSSYTPSASPNSLQHKSSLIDLKDWVIDDGPLNASPPSAALTGYSPPQTSKGLPHEGAPLISFEVSPPLPAKAPPLPPRKPSYSSLRSVSAPAASPTTTAPSATNMLMPPDADHSYPPAIGLSTNGTRRGHAPASSISSFHSVSLSDGGDGAAAGAVHASPVERDWTGTGTEDAESLDESFENVSAPSSFLPPVILPPRPPPKPPGKPAFAPASKPAPSPPRLPQRPPAPPARGSAGSFASTGSSPSPGSSPAPALMPTPSTSTASLTRRAPPPPPVTSPPPPPPARSRPPSARTSLQSTASDRSSLFSQLTTASRTSYASSRASASTPPAKQQQQQQQLAARARYDALFSANARAHAPRLLPAARRQNAGWRGLSVDIDLGLAPPAEPGPDARLDGRVVQRIWLKSHLAPQRLRAIWTECDPDGTGTLDRDAFARGMARIDEELRRAQVLGAGPYGAAMARRSASRPILR
ncbi:hypothetical protein BC834DRAFT_971373 [Gloeopeniophorella convolvens]|nr:hypothetical protein BC834DRAFT_971373 [Gloeopeniophorella convolvens]